MFLPRESDIATAQVTELSDSKLYQVISINDVAIKNAQELELRFFEQTGYTGNLEIRLFDYDMQSEVVYSKNVSNTQTYKSSKLYSESLDREKKIVENISGIVASQMTNELSLQFQDDF